MTIHEMQNLNRDTIEFASKVIAPGMSLIKLRKLCEEYMLSHGADSFWYWDIGAFVFAGDKTAVSVSGHEYETDHHIIKSNDIITIDLSPQNNHVWGDYARTLIVENGSIVKGVEQIRNCEWRNGLKMENALHEAMLDFINENTTFDELFYYINELITSGGYVNLDFLGNLGHSIVKNKRQRIYIEKGNKEKLSAVEAFTFEPHISLPGSVYGFKKENIYSFNSGIILEL
jgi:Xaa-Pro aminopeptidase